MDNAEQRMKQIKRAIDEFGGLLHDYRLVHNLSLQDMSDIMGYSPSYIWRVENYKRFPGMSTKLKMLLTMWTTEEVYSYLDEIIKKEKNKLVE